MMKLLHLADTFLSAVGIIFEICLGFQLLNSA